MILLPLIPIIVGMGLLIGHTHKSETEIAKKPSSAPVQFIKKKSIKPFECDEKSHAYLLQAKADILQEVSEIQNIGNNNASPSAVIGLIKRLNAEFVANECMDDANELLNMNTTSPEFGAWLERSRDDQRKTISLALYQHGMQDLAFEVAEKIKGPYNVKFIYKDLREEAIKQNGGRTEGLDETTFSKCGDYCYGEEKKQADEFERILLTAQDLISKGDKPQALNELAKAQTTRPNEIQNLNQVVDHINLGILFEKAGDHSSAKAEVEISEKFLELSNWIGNYHTVYGFITADNLYQFEAVALAIVEPERVLPFAHHVSPQNADTHPDQPLSQNNLVGS